MKARQSVPIWIEAINTVIVMKNCRKVPMPSSCDGRYSAKLKG